MGKAGFNHDTYLPHRTPRKTYISRITLFLSRWSIDVRSQLRKKTGSPRKQSWWNEWLAARSRETSKWLTHSLLPSNRVLHRERSAPGVHAFYDAIYMHNVTVASTWEHGYVAISCRSFLLRDPTRTVLLPTLRSTFPAGKRKMIRGQGGKARDRDARDWPMGFFGAARGSPRGLASNLLRIHIQRDNRLL